MPVAIAGILLQIPNLRVLDSGDKTALLAEHGLMGTVQHTANTPL
jgi:hypothetical protein